jgi:hypothetical protein
MGLDTFALRSPDEGLTAADRQAFEEAGIELCGGTLSGSAGSFRDQFYDDLIREITGVGTYQAWIPPETLREMYYAPAQWVPEEALETGEAAASFWREHTVEEIIQLRRFFRVCAERGLGLAGWW